jgi:hypothetical protein
MQRPSSIGSDHSARNARPFKTSRFTEDDSIRKKPSTDCMKTVELNETGSPTEAGTKTSTAKLESTDADSATTPITKARSQTVEPLHFLEPQPIEDETLLMDMKPEKRRKRLHHYQHHMRGDLWRLVHHRSLRELLHRRKKRPSNPDLEKVKTRSGWKDFLYMGTR